MHRTDSYLLYHLTGLFGIWGLYSCLHVITDEEIDNMSIDDLLHVEHDLRNQNGQVDKHIASLHGRLGKLREKQGSLEKTQKKVEMAFDFEVRQRKARVKDLQRAKAEVEAKKNQVLRLTEEAGKLRERIREMSETVLSLNQEKHHLEDQYAHPSLQDAFLNDAERIGPVTQHVANKTVEVIFPELRLGLEEAEYARHALQHSKPVTTLFTSLVVYLLAVCVIWLSYRCARNVCRKLTMERVFFTIDIAFAFVWLLVCVCYLLLMTDPLQRLANAHSGLSLIVQLMVMAGLVCNVGLRCLLVSTLVSVPAVSELVCVTFVAQHYYQNVWMPLLFDESVLTGFMAFIGYMIVNGGLAVYRARRMGRPVEKLRIEFEEVDGIMKSGEWLKGKMERTVQYCEDWLTKGALEKHEDDEESNRTCSIAELKTRLSHNHITGFLKER